jgi:hypothetical protein
VSADHVASLVKRCADDVMSGGHSLRASCVWLAQRAHIHNLDTPELFRLLAAELRARRYVDDGPRNPPTLTTEE